MKKRNVFLTALLLCSSLSVSAAVQLSSSRIIFKQEQKEATLSLKNTSSNKSFLIQAWMSDQENNKLTSSPFLLTPPLFKMAQNSSANIRIINSGRQNFSQDKETLFRLNLLSIPSQTDAEGAKLVVNNQSIIKFIYRPASLSDHDAALAYQKLQIKSDGKYLTLTNPTPYYVNIGQISLNGANLGANGLSVLGTVPPLGAVTLPYNAALRNVTLTAIGDRGALLTPRSVQLR